MAAGLKVHQSSKFITVCVCVCVSLSELSEVLWHFFVQMPMSMHGHGIDKLRWILMFCAWAIWAVLTIAILLLMEGLSAFLHTLRLHWSVILPVQVVVWKLSHSDSRTSTLVQWGLRKGVTSCYMPVYRLHNNNSSNAVSFMCTVCSWTYGIITVQYR